MKHRETLYLFRYSIHASIRWYYLGVFLELGRFLKNTKLLFTTLKNDIIQIFF